MSPYLSVILQSVILPFGLSGLLVSLGPHKNGYQLPGSAIIWLLAYAWITGLPNVPPEEAMDWLWLLLAASYAGAYIPQQRVRASVLVGILAAVIIAVAWPVLYYQPSSALAVELVTVVITGGVLFMREREIRATATAAALILTVNATGLAVASALSGSLLVGQLLAALAAVSGGYAIAGMFDRLHGMRFSTQHILVFMPLYLGLLAIARLYAELPLTSAVLLLVSPLISMLIRWRHGWAVSLLLSAVAIGVLLNTS